MHQTLFYIIKHILYTFLIKSETHRQTSLVTTTNMAALKKLDKVRKHIAKTQTEIGY